MFTMRRTFFLALTCFKNSASGAVSVFSASSPAPNSLSRISRREMPKLSGGSRMYKTPINAIAPSGSQMYNSGIKFPMLLEPDRFWATSMIMMAIGPATKAVT